MFSRSNKKDSDFERVNKGFSVGNMEEKIKELISSQIQTKNSTQNDC